LAAAAAALAGPAAAQALRGELAPAGYREGMPAVNAAPKPTDPDAGNHAASASFSAWNRRAGRPSILVFFNRELIEDSATQYDSVTTAAAVGVAEQGAFVARGRQGAVAGSASRAAVVAETRSYQERSTDGRYGFRSGAFSKAVETSLLSTFLGAEARVVSREALIRNVSASRSKDDRLDIQHLETLALQKGIEYLIEVLPDDNASSPTGASFTVRITHLPTSTVKATFITSGDPPRGLSRLVAGPDGFERRPAASRATPEGIGAQVAYDIMGKLR
jgi:hypothetical protein